MSDNEYLARIISQKLESGSSVVLVSIVSFQGSTPRHAGTKMAVDAGGCYGTIGGSLLEAAAITKARNVLVRKQAEFMHFDLAGKDAYSNGMICGGKAVLLLDYIPAGPENREFFQCWRDAVSGDKDFFYVTRLKESGDSVNITGRCLLYPDGKMLGNCRMTESETEDLRSELHNVSSTTVLTLNDSQVIVDSIRKLKTVYLFGAGHVALPTARIASLVGFRVVVADDRDEFANAERFPDAEAIHIIEDYTRALEGMDIDKDSFIVILTRGHRYDREVLEQALKTRAGYIGMISSRKKRDAIYTALMESGMKKEDLEKVHSPIGLAIGAETPEEIAVSIVGELIGERRKQQK